MTLYAGACPAHGKEVSGMDQVDVDVRPCESVCNTSTTMERMAEQ